MGSIGFSSELLKCKCYFLQKGIRCFGGYGGLRVDFSFRWISQYLKCDCRPWNLLVSWRMYIVKTCTNNQRITMNSKRKPVLTYIVAAMLALLTSIVALAAPPDLTSGGVPNEDPAITFNLGPTGMRGWAYHVKQDTGESRQILVTDVDAGSPASGVLAVDDVILGASGTGSSPVNFTQGCCFPHFVC